MNVTSKGEVNQMSFELSVTRCPCPEGTDHGGEVCPDGRLENIGLVACYHRSTWGWLMCRLTGGHPHRTKEASAAIGRVTG